MTPGIARSLPVWLVILLTSIPCLHAQPAERPNLILIIADDLSWDDCGAYGHPNVRTPNLDALAREGMRFDRAFLTASSCSPSRASIITGRYPHATDAEQLHWPLPREQTTFVELLKQAGYWTAAAGKWHLGDEVKDRFDVVKEADPTGFQLPTGVTKEPAGQMTAKGDPSGCADWVPTLKERPRDQPFFLWLAALDPHRDYEEGILLKPHQPADVIVPPYLPDQPAVRKELALYYDEITRLDDYVGQVLAELERQQVAQNTFILFLSDNGRPFPRDKCTVYDSGIKTPWIVRWPGRVKPGSVCASLVSSVDIAPTLLALAGLKSPPTFQGQDFAPLLKNPSANIREFVFAERHWHDYEDLVRAVRDDRFKYIRNLYPELPNTPPADAVRSPTYREMQRLRDAGQLAAAQMACFTAPRPAEEFYDTKADPHELRNLIGDPKHAGRLQRLRAALADWQRETGDRLPAVRTADEFDRESGRPLPNRIRPRPSKKEMAREAGRSQR